MRESCRLAVLDDTFPNLLTGFRVAEFVHYLRTFPQMRILSTNADPQHYNHFASLYNDLSSRVELYDNSKLDNIDIASCVFLNNAYYFLPELERREIPFVMTLYPGGGFNLNDPESAMKLNTVLSSRTLRSVIATQPITKAVLGTAGCSVPIFDIPGVVVDPIYAVDSMPRAFRNSNGPIKICFAAFRYDMHGRSKGFPEFIQAAETIARLIDDIKFAVVGDLSPLDWPLTAGLNEKIEFTGPLRTDDLRSFFKEQDAIISPSRRHAISGKDFDGFPTGTCVEASLCGAAILSSDELNQNRYYVPGKEILISRPDAVAIVGTLLPFLKDRSRLRALGEAGRRKTVSLYGPAAQLVPRTELLCSLSRSLGIDIEYVSPA